MVTTFERRLGRIEDVILEDGRRPRVYIFSGDRLAACSLRDCAKRECETPDGSPCARCRAPGEWHEGTDAPGFAPGSLVRLYPDVWGEL